MAVSGTKLLLLARKRITNKDIFTKSALFWHGCPKPKHAPLPKTRAQWWAAKLARNCARDLLVTRTLRKAGWRVVRVWECDLAKKNWPRVARRVTRALDLGKKRKLATD